MPHSDSTASNSPLQTNPVSVKEKPALSRRKLKIICVGAGYSGLTLAYKIEHECNWKDVIDLQIYEKNENVGGTWFENTYPGVACDIPASKFIDDALWQNLIARQMLYTFSFEPNPDWSKFYCSGDEISVYIERNVQKYSLDKHVILESRVLETIWDNDIGKWKV